ncbi:MAG TPA: DUF4129 domain-containing protein [Pyrinomonadaceae bacterium]|nr:DUF4129 domain-containing protein [Pyrinomonadaceae bacterium]
MPQISTKSFSRSALCAVVLAVFWCLCPARAVAIPISQYQQRLKDAIASLEEFNEVDEEEITSEYDAELNRTLESIRNSLPRNHTVETDGEVYNVDNSWLHKNLDELKSNASRSERLAALVESLEAMEARVGERQGGSEAIESKNDANTRLKSILARPEYTSTVKGPNALTRLLKDFVEWLRSLFPKPQTVKPGSARWLEVVAKVLVGLTAGALLVFLIRLLLTRFRRSKKIKRSKKKEPRIVLGERLEPEQTATDLLSEAEALARSGDLRAAIRKAYIALLVELGDRKIISLAQHKTNRDYLNGLRDLPPLHSRMTGLTQSFERHWYGFVEATQSDWQNFRDGYLAALHRGN